MSAVERFVAAAGDVVAFAIAHAQPGHGLRVRAFALSGEVLTVAQEDARQLLAQLAALPTRTLFVSDPAALALSHRAELDWLRVDAARCSSWLVASRVLSASVEGVPVSLFAEVWAAASAADRGFALEAAAEDVLWRAVAARGVPVSASELAAALRRHRGVVDRFTRVSRVDLMGRDADHRIAVWLRRNGAQVFESEQYGWVHPGNFDASGMDAEAFAAYKAAHSSRTRLWKLRELSTALHASEGSTVHPRIDVNGTSTGRHKITQPSLQSVARDLRSVVCAPAGRQLVSADHSSAEVVVLAALVGDASLAARDVYQEIADAVGAERKVVKPRVLAWMYGEGKRGCAAYVGEELAARLHDAIEWALPEVVALRAQLEARVRAGEHLSTLRGRRLPLIEPGKAFRALNQVLQGSAKDAFAEAVARVALLDAVELVLPMHDEVIVSVPLAANPPAVAAQLQQAMAVTLPGGIEMRSDVEWLGAHWGQKQP